MRIKLDVQNSPLPLQSGIGKLRLLVRREKFHVHVPKLTSCSEQYSSWRNSNTNLGAPVDPFIFAAIGTANVTHATQAVSLATTGDLSEVQRTLKIVSAVS